MVSPPTSELWEKRLPRGCLVERDDALLDLCRGKLVLHLGAADAPFHKEAAAAGRLLHQKVRKTARRLVGIDLDREAVDFLRENYGVEDIICGDAASGIRNAALKQAFEVVLCCDLLEHVDNPAELLECCKAFMAPGALLVITTINALALKLGLRALFHREAVHPGHVAYYSYATLCALLKRHGLSPDGAGFFCYATRSAFAAVLFGTLARFAPGCADGILVTCKTGE